MLLQKKSPKIDHLYILSKISDYDIYRYEIPDLVIGRAIRNPFRKDRDPSLCVYLAEDGRIHHIDYADDTWRGTCWDLVKQKYGITISEAIKHVAKVFMLVDGSVDAHKAITSQYTKPEMEVRKHCLIQVTIKRWNKESLRFWEEYGITKEELLEEDVYPVKECYINRRRLVLQEDELCYCYKYQCGYKLYRPYAPKMDKWKSNIPLDTPMHLENLNKDHNTLIVKSLKDYLVCRKLYPYTCYVQNESIGSVTPETAKYITENSKEVYYMGDSDEPGKKASYKITKAYGWKHINTPDHLLPVINDPAGWVKEMGYAVLHEHMIKKKLIE